MQVSLGKISDWSNADVPICWGYKKGQAMPTLFSASKFCQNYASS